LTRDKIDVDVSERASARRMIAVPGHSNCDRTLPCAENNLGLAASAMITMRCGDRAVRDFD
jgi:hypothetical protein